MNVRWLIWDGAWLHCRWIRTWLKWSWRPSEWGVSILFWPLPVACHVMISSSFPPLRTKGRWPCSANSTWLRRLSAIIWHCSKPINSGREPSMILARDRSGPSLLRCSTCSTTDPHNSLRIEFQLESTCELIHSIDWSSQILWNSCWHLPHRFGGSRDFNLKRVVHWTVPMILYRRVKRITCQWPL